MKEIIIPVLLFTLTMTITPGPNNMLLTASGALFGFKRTVPFIGGIVLGIMSQLLLSSLGLGVLFNHYPMIQKIMKIAGSLYIFYLAFKIAFSNTRASDKGVNEKPLSLMQGALFQYLNPKAYVMTITAMSVYPLSGELYRASTVFILCSFLVIMPVSISLWAGFGTLINQYVNQDKNRSVINIILGGVTAVSALFLLV